MSDVQRELRLGRHFDFTGKHALRERTARVVPEHLSDAAKLVGQTCHAGIRGADHWPSSFYAPKYRIGQVLMRSSGTLKLSVVSHIYEQVRTGTCLSWKNKLSGELA